MSQTVTGEAYRVSWVMSEGEPLTGGFLLRNQGAYYQMLSHEGEEVNRYIIKRDGVGWSAWKRFKLGADVFVVRVARLEEFPQLSSFWDYPVWLPLIP